MQDIVVLAPDSQAPALAADSLPDGLDPKQHRIIATHFFGWQHLGDVAARIVQRIPPPECEP